LPEYYVYIMTNQQQTTLYTGITNDIYRRVNQHKSGKGSKFTSKYHLTMLVYFETFDYVDEALAREKQIKGGSRQRKIDLINEINPDWEDLFDQLQF